MGKLSGMPVTPLYLKSSMNQLKSQRIFQPGCRPRRTRRSVRESSDSGELSCRAPRWPSKSARYIQSSFQWIFKKLRVAKIYINKNLVHLNKYWLKVVLLINK